MQVILHTGVHCTDDDRLLKGLLRNADALRTKGVAVPGPGRYRALLTEAAASLGQSSPFPEAREVLLDAILSQDPDQVGRMLLSHENFFAVPKLALTGGRLYRNAEARLAGVAQMFRGDEIQLFMGLRNPATWLPAMYAATPHANLDDFLQGHDPMHLRWSDLIRRIRDALPDMPITLWCNEDTPLIWGQILRDMAGVEPGRKITGAFDLLQDIMNPEGMQRFRAYLRDHPQINERQKRRVMIAFLDKYAISDAIEEELDLPGWDSAYVDMLTELYEDDVDEIGRIPGVTLLSS
ncbi:hypothetical protein [Puniceibacterium sp. IMCC21224]|uniref:hypothetical protein n=1 Tax=Puniceibacterium sp. IMCC21224 TaxID=1618204 RepID=UPI00064E1351|nr:hypothetical protein [Puniceibacterium sp. IMCC21224]KMK68617.1 hypothetical protein IMCC21224_113500 [Puniceibacterium sp. IMCC21224]